MFRSVSRLAGGAALVLGVLAGCSDEPRSPGPGFLDEVDVSPKATVVVDESGFEPSTLTLRVGDAFDVVNEGSGPHSFTLDEPYVDTGSIDPGESTRVVLTSEGTHEARDRENPSAELTVTVEPETAAAG